MGDELFQQVVATCGLSSLFASNAMRRALSRANVDVARMNATDLKRAIPEIRRTLEPFLEQDLEPTMQRIERLTRV